MDNDNQAEAKTSIPKPSGVSSANTHLKQSRQYDGWLVSDKFHERCLAVVGHYLVGSIAISIILALVFFAFGLLAGVYSI